MAKNGTSDSSMRRRIREALATSPATHRISSSPIQTKPPLPQPLHLKFSTEEAGAIPIKFDYSTPTSNGNGLQGQAAKVEAEPHSKTKIMGFSAKAVKGQENRVGVELEQKGKKDINHDFTEYIKRTGYKIRAVSNVGRGQSGNPTAPDEASGTKKNDNHREHFSNFIEFARKKIRTTTTIRRD